MGLEQFDTIIAFSAVMLTLSLLVTIIVQMVLAVLNLRGKGLAWGVERMLQQFDPSLNLKGIAGKLADVVLHHPSLTQTDRRRAIAIRKDELLKVLEEIAAEPTPPPAAPAPTPPAALTPTPPAPRAGKSLGAKLAKLPVLRWLLPTTWREWWQRQFGFGPGLTAGEQRILQDALAKLTPAASAAQAQSAIALTSELAKVFPGAEAAVRRAVSGALNAKRQIEADVEKWFDTVMDRTTERFVGNTRAVTAIVAALIAIGLQVDALSIFAQLTSSKDLRNQWVEASSGLLKEAEKVAADTDTPWPVGTLAIRAMAKDKDKALSSEDVAKIEKVPDGLLTRADGLKWVQENNLSTAARDLYLAKVEEVAKQRLDELSGAFSRVRKVAAGTSLQLAVWPWRWPEAKAWIGILISALLLGLGGPFWFNLLKQLTSLRPLIAGKVEDKPQSGKA